MYGPALPLTAGGIAVGGIVLDQLGLVGTALVLIMGGAVLIKLTFRRGKKVTEV